MLASNVLFVSVTIHSWRGQFEVAGAEVKVDEETIDDEVVSKPRWTLLPQSWRLRFGRIEHAARREVEKKALPFPLPGLSVIPLLAAADVFAAVDARAKELDAAADEFVAEWPRIVGGIEEKVPANRWPAVKAKLPTAEGLRKKFAVVRRVVPVGGMGSTIDGEGATAYAREVQQKAAQFIDETAAVMANGLRDELAAAADALVGRLADRGVVKAANLAHLREAFDKLEAFRFLTGPAVQDRLREARERLKGLDPSALNDSTRKGDGALAAELTSLIRGVTDGLAADRKFSATGRAARSVL